MSAIVKNTMIISVLTLLSRILGLVRDTIIAMMFGTGLFADVFFLAFKPFDLVRKLFSEGILAGSFVPDFTRECRDNGPQSGVGLLYAVLSILCAAGILLMIISVFLAPVFLEIMVPGFSADTYAGQLTLVLFKIMLPYLVFIMATGLTMGALNAMESFAGPGMTPAVFNVIIIGFALFVAPFFDTPVFALAAGVVTGGLTQFLLLVMFLYRANLLRPVRLKGYGSKAMAVCRKMVPTMIGTAGFQINMVVAAFFAAGLETGSVSGLYFAERLVQLPLALFAVSAATVALPEYSRKEGADNPAQLNRSFSDMLKMILFLTIPASAGLMALNQPIVQVLFERGAFDREAVYLTAGTLFYLAPGLCAFSGIRICATLFFAKERIDIPFLNGLCAIALNVVLCLVLMQVSGTQGLVASVSISAAASFLHLLFALGKIIELDFRSIGVCACRSLFLSVIMFFFVRVSAEAILTGVDGFARIAGLFGSILIGIAVYLGAGMLVAKKEVKQLLKGAIQLR